MWIYGRMREDAMNEALDWICIYGSIGAFGFHAFFLDGLRKGGRLLRTIMSHG